MGHMGCMTHMNVVDCCLLKALLSLKAKTPSFGPYALVLTPTRTVTAAVTSSQRVFFEVPRVLYKSEHDLKNSR